MKLVRPLQALVLAAVVLLALIVMMAVVSALTDLTGALIVLGLILVLLALLGLARRWVRRGTVLELDLDHGVREEPMSGALGRYINPGALVLRDVTDALARASGDDRVVGMVARLGNGQIGLGHAQELRDSIMRFRAAGKRTVAFAESFGEGGLATVDYYLATAFEEIHLQPHGQVHVTGVVARVPFLRGLLDRVSVFPDLDHRREYKSAKYTLTEQGFTAPHEEATRAVLEDQFEQMVSGISAARSLPPDQVRELIDHAPLLASEAVEAGLVDRSSYRDEAYHSALEAGRQLMLVDAYLRRAGRPNRRGAKVALIHGTGSIHRGRSRFDPLSRGLSLGADDVAAAFRAAIDDRKVQAIVFRVDSPGGSAVASEVIRRETVRAREAGKPVVVSMANVAGSGGYWISATANRIVAQPGTITGSIGVVAGKLATRNAWQRVGVDWEELHLGQNATFGVPNDPYTDSERERLKASLDSIYEEFKSLVAEGRSLDPAAVEQLAKGRIWTGAQALERGLVDALGGTHRALELAAEVAGIAPGRGLAVRVYPQKRGIRLPERKESSEPVRQLTATLVDRVDAVTGSPRTPAVQAVMPSFWSGSGRM
ncbi:MAG TPA: signal peptide peptidase SppA [Acidimicrobiia bacterium]|nr:signal peptide peptidase SppA [Acidimicrobiia bacterium]